MKKIISTFIMVVISILCMPLSSSAQVMGYGGAKVTLTFDDGHESIYTKALPILESRGLKATAYITTNFIGQPGYMTWDQVRSLQNDFGWEIGSHSVSHPSLRESDHNTIVHELSESLNTLLSNGLNVTNFALPYGEYNNTVLSVLAGYYNSNRIFWYDSELNRFPYQKLELTTQSVDQSESLSTILSRIDEAKEKNRWLTLTLHEITEEPDPYYDYVTTTSDLAEITDYIVGSQLPVVNIEESLDLSGNNMISNPSFENGLDSWSVDNPNYISVDTNKNGRYPQETSSLKILGSSQKTHIFSNRFNVSNTKKYALTTYVNSDNLSNGYIEFYIDEYNADGNWTSGQWVGYVASDSVTEFTHLYTPSSSDVVSAGIQIYLTENSNGFVYIDAVKLHNISGEVIPSPTPTDTPTPTPTVEPTPTETPEPTPDNLVLNPSYEEVDSSGWAVNWIRQTMNFLIDLFSNGNDGVNSVKLEGNNRTHLFSEKIEIDNTKTYRWDTFIKVVELGSEFGFYIDEYNADGNWISGQWKGMVGLYQNGIVGFVYTPTSDNVAQIGLQYYNVGGAPNKLYLDSVKFVAN